MRIVGQLGEKCLTTEGLMNSPCPQDEEGRPAKEYGSFTFSYGPLAGGPIESLALDVLTRGESVDWIDYVSSKNRKIPLAGLRVEDAILKVERINANFGAAHSIAFLIAVEKALEVEPDEKVVSSRIVELELERVRNHLLVLHRLLDAASLLVPAYTVLSAVEQVNRTIGRACGHRYFMGANFLGGTVCRFEPSMLVGWTFMKEMWKVLENRIFVDRLSGNGVIKDNSLIGPAARAAGMAFDARCDGGDLPYDGFRPVSMRDGDALSRLMVRMEEVESSIEMLSEMRTEPSSFIVPERTGEGIARVESPSGDLAYLVEVEGRMLRKVEVLPPSRANLRAFLSSSRGAIFTDIPFNWESFGYGYRNWRWT